jgi:ATP-dependent 26S proteasome regulatory subunit
MSNTLLVSVRMLREELQLLQEQGSLVGEVVKAMDKKKVLVKVMLSCSLGANRRRIVSQRKIYD